MSLLNRFAKPARAANPPRAYHKQRGKRERCPRKEGLQKYTRERAQSYAILAARAGRRDRVEAWQASCYAKATSWRACRSRFHAVKSTT